jgi:hypothetical protein
MYNMKLIHSIIINLVTFSNTESVLNGDSVFANISKTLHMSFAALAHLADNNDSIQFSSVLYY